MNETLGEALGKLYVERHFPPGAKARVEELIENLFAAFGEGIDELEWMSTETKAEAKRKLAGMSVVIGYPEKWTDYSGLEIRSDDLVGNVMRANRFAFRETVGQLGRPVDRTGMNDLPHQVDAGYIPWNNKITFTAGLLNPPFFDPQADPAVNYGAIGAAIGHEISHAFDDQGRKYDPEGALRDWWSPEDAQRFEERSAKLEAQYSAFEPLPGLRVNGQLTLGENIADLSGLTVAYRAYRRSLGDGEAPVIAGLTGDQRFFLGWAQIWRSKSTEGALRQRILSIPHSPEQYRTNGVVSNMEEFYRAFAVEEGDRLYLAPDARVKIW